MIKIENLSKQYRQIMAIDQLNLDIKEGEIFGFLGPNGAGKTTTIKLMAGLLKPTCGRVLVGPYDVQKEPLAAKRLMGFVPDQPFVYPKLTGFEFLRFVGDLYDVPWEEQEQKIGEYLHMFELRAFAHHLVASYSHGMRQKLIIASLLLHKPRYIFMDEPMVGLDPKTARLVKEIMQYLSLQGVTFFLCPHPPHGKRYYHNSAARHPKNKGICIKKITGKPYQAQAHTQQRQAIHKKL